MQPTQDPKQLLSEVIKKQIVILGPDITLAKARNVPGLVVADDGTVTDLSGDPQQITQKLIDQFVQLSGEIVRKTMEPLLTMSNVSTQPAPAQPTQSNIAPQSVSQPPMSTPAPVATPPSSPNPTPQMPPPAQNSSTDPQQVTIPPETLAEQAKPVQ